MYFTYILAALVILIIFFHNYFKRTYIYWEKKNVVGPKPVPFFGNIKSSALRHKHIAAIYKEIYDMYPDEKMVGIYRMVTPALIIRDLDLVKHIMIKDFETFPDRGIEFSKEGLGDNLFHADVDTWRALRNRITPIFTAGKLRNMMHLLTTRGDKFVDYLETICLKQPEQEVLHLFQKYTSATIMAFAFGLDVDTVNDTSGILEKVDKLMFKSNYSSEIDMLYPGIWKKTNSSIFSAVVNKFCYEVVDAVLHQRNGKHSARNDAFDLLMELQSGKDTSFKLTEHVMAGQVFILFAAGNGNNSNALSFSMYNLAKNPEVQNKLIEEIDEVLQRYDGQLTYEALQDMTYLDQVFYETLRMNPTTNSLPRSAAKDYKIPGTDVIIEKGTTVIISPLAIHHDERNYPNPEKFIPERFSPENMKKRHSCAYLPFGVGPRSCLGTQFGKMQFKVCAAKMLSKFRVEISRRTTECYKFDPMRSLLWAEGGIYLKIVPRDLD